MTAEGVWRSEAAERTSEPRPKVLDPQTLIRGNLAFKALEPKVLAGMTGADFDPIWYKTQRAEVIRVVDHDPKNELGYYHLAYNGYHRIWAAHTYQDYLRGLAATGKISQDQAKYDLVVNDVTDTLGGRYAGKTVVTKSGEIAFTPSQALELVVTPTEAHKNITAKRFAGHLLTEWGRMVPPDVSDRYSALAALTFLGRKELFNQPAEETEKYLGISQVSTTKHPEANGDPPKKPAVLMAGLPDADRPALAKGLSEVAAVIRSSSQGYDDIVFNAFQLAATLDEPDSDDIKLKQMQGLIALPEVHSKIKAKTTDPSVISDRQSDLTLLLYDNLSMAAANVRENRSFRQALTDPHLPYGNLVEVLQPPTADVLSFIQPPPAEGSTKIPSISARYDAVRRLMNYQQLNYLLTRNASPRNLEFALSLARNLSQPVFMDLGEIADLAVEIDDADKAAYDARSVAAQLAIKASHAAPGSQADTYLTQSQGTLLHLATRVRKPNGLGTSTNRVRRLTSEGRELLQRPQQMLEAAASNGGEIKVFDHEDPEAIIAAFRNYLSTAPLTPALRRDLRTLTQIIEPLASVDWDKVPFDPDKDGREASWFSGRFTNGNTELKDGDRNKVTLMTRQIVRNVHPQIRSGDGLQILLDIQRDKDGYSGLDAIDNSLSNRLAFLAGKVKWWSKTIKDFRYLVFAHYGLSVKTRLEKMKEQQSTGSLSNGDTALLPVIEGMDKVFDNVLAEETTELRNKTPLYAELITYTLYAPPGSQTVDNARRLIASKENDAHILGEALAKLKRETEADTVVELFKKEVLPQAA